MVGYLLITVGIGLTVMLMSTLPAWLWDLLALAQAGRTAQARLPATEEQQLRLARDVHDVDADRSAREAEQVQRLTGSAVDEVRQTVHGCRAIDLREQLSAIAHRPDVAVVDLEMPKLSGLEVAGELATALPSCAVVILTGHGRPRHIQRALTAPECPLTPRELDVLRLAEHDTPMSVIAKQTHLSNGTVRNYLAAAIDNSASPAGPRLSHST